MRVGVIRGDMPGPVTLMDLESVSQHNPSTEPRGQEITVERPSVDNVAAVVANIPAGIQGSVDISGGITVVVATSDDLIVLDDGDGGSGTATVAAAVYASGQALVDAVNTALGTASLAVTARLDDSGTNLVLQSDVTGEGSTILIDSAGDGSNFNGLVGLTDDDTFVVPGAAAVITALSPVGGPLALEAADFDGAVGAGATDAQNEALGDLIAPRFVETDVAIKSAQVGMIAGFASASYNPDPNRKPALANGAAVSVVADDGSAFSAPLTAITSATADSPAAGDITFVGTNMGNSEWENQTVVKVTSADGKTTLKINQHNIVADGGTVSPTSLVVKAASLAGLGVADSVVQVFYTSLASEEETVV